MLRALVFAPRGRGLKQHEIEGDGVAAAVFTCTRGISSTYSIHAPLQLGFLGLDNGCLGVELLQRVEDSLLEIHLVKEGQIISKDARSQAKLIRGMQLVLARNYIENLRELVKKGMREKAEQGIYPGRAPLGCRNNKADRTVEVHPENAEIVTKLFEMYASGQFSLSMLGTALRTETGKTISRAYLHTILTNPFYMGSFIWGGQV
jgi:DNA invertase Pin-like site-specific DNA recombinase